ncbi:MAG TPA: metal ABC transporter substrate-binding protein [Devosia sp.]|nr:metal ABC transporter substrate-binding protein [Devosia sp.]
MILKMLAGAALVTLTIANPAGAAEVSAVASFSILGDMVKVIGGDRVTVTTIVGPNADTHVYEPKPGDAIAVAGADIFFVNGLGFEGWMERFVESTGYKGPLVVATTGIATHTMDDEGEVVTDPHAWQSLGNGLVYADNIAAGLCGVDAEGCATYKASAAAYKSEMSALDAEVRAEIAAIPEGKRKVITTHDAFGYFALAYGVSFLAPEGVSTESEASAQDVAKLVEQIRTEGVSALFIENMSDPRLLQQIASETGVTVGGELYADALSEPDGPAPDYLSMFRYNIGQLIPAMRGG